MKFTPPGENKGGEWLMRRLGGRWKSCVYEVSSFHLSTTLNFWPFWFSSLSYFPVFFLRWSDFSSVVTEVCHFCMLSSMQFLVRWVVSLRISGTDQIDKCFELQTPYMPLSLRGNNFFPFWETRWIAVGYQFHSKFLLNLKPHPSPQSFVCWLEL